MPIATDKRKLDNGTEVLAKRTKSAKNESQFEIDLSRLSQEIKANGSERDQKWARPALQGFSPANDELVFQQIDAEEAMVNGECVVRLFGVTEAGHSVLCNITGFRHYFYVPAPVGFRTDDISTLIRSIDVCIVAVV
jgi:DNA polymerase delta subunit 1